MRTKQTLDIELKIRLGEYDANNPWDSLYYSFTDAGHMKFDINGNLIDIDQPMTVMELIDCLGSGR